MRKLLTLIVFIVAIFLENPLNAESGLFSLSFQGTDAQYLYAVPHGWKKTTDNEDPIKFIRNDGEFECYLAMESFKWEEIIDESDLLLEILRLNDYVYGENFIKQTDLHKFSYFDSNDERAVLALKYKIGHQEGQMVQYTCKVTSGEEEGAVSLLVKQNQIVESLDEEFDVITEFLSNITFLD